MGKNTGTYIIIIFLVIVGIFLIPKMNLFHFSILPAGQNSHTTDCSFITNVGGTLSIDDYKDSSAWIYFDSNSDGTKELYVYDGSGALSEGMNYCDNIGGTYISQQSAGGHKIKQMTSTVYYLCNGNKIVIFAKNIADPTKIPTNPYVSCTPTSNPSATCFTNTDLDSSGKMTRTTLGKAINCWVIGQ